MERFFGICNLSVAPVRAEPSDKAEIKSQLLFGDCFEVLETIERWTRTLTFYDSYEGWIDSKQYASIKEEDLEKFNDSGNLSGLFVGQHLIKQATGEKIYLPPGCFFPSSGNDFMINNVAYEFHGDIFVPEIASFKERIEHVAKFYLHSPYLWGGRTMFGIDCSGFAQIVYKLCGIKINRDARQQAEQGKAVDFLPASQTGDLAFFDNEEGRIIHVGIMLGNSHIIHAAGRVKIDRIDDQGIFSEELGKYSHKLRIVKRFV